MIGSVNVFMIKIGPIVRKRINMSSKMVPRWLDKESKEKSSAPEV